jgi:hypothetical protein
MQRALVASCGYVPSSPIIVTLMMEALSTSETSVLTRATWRKIPEDGILNSLFLHLTCHKQSQRGSQANNIKNKQTLWPLVRKRTIPTERLPLVDEI